MYYAAMIKERPYWMLRVLYSALRLSLVLAFVIFLLRNDWASAFYTFLIFLLVSVPSFLKERFSIFIPFELDLALGGFTYLALFLGSLNKFYDRFPLWDGVLHFQSGILLGVFGYVMIFILNDQKKGRIKLSPGFLSFFAFTFSLALGALWEIFEYLVDLSTHIGMQETGLPDTMSDLMVNAIGALIITTIGYFWMHRHFRIPFTPRLLARFSRKNTSVKK